MILRVHNNLRSGESFGNTIRQIMEIRHMFREDIAEDISSLSNFMEILAEQRKELLKIANHPLFGADKPEPEQDMTEPDSLASSEAETVIKGSVGKDKGRSEF